jgi:hypothetical protein
MDKETRNLLANTTQAIRRALEEEFRLQLEGTFDVHEDGRIEDRPGAPLDDKQKLVRRKIISAIEHRRSMGESDAESVRGFLREAAFTLLNRLAALKMMEARGIVQECVSACGWRDGKQDTEAVFEARGFKEFSGLAPGLIELPDKGYRLYLECIFDEIGREVGVLFDRTDSASLLWPRRKALADALTFINASGLAGIWIEDETIGWIYQYYNDPAERRQMREKSAAPRNSREMAVRNQFFTPRYVVEFLTDNSLGRLWYEMTKGRTELKDKCRYMIRSSNEVFLGNPSVISHLASAAPWVRQVIETADFRQLPENPTVAELSDFALAIDGYGEMERRGKSWEHFIETFYNPQAEAVESDGRAWTGDAFELWAALFAYQREVLRNGFFNEAATASDDKILRHLWPPLRASLMEALQDLSKEELLKQPVFIPHRPLKDPREIRMLDPACGSMHFGLYAFDLFEVIYEEARAGHRDVGTAELREAKEGFALERDFASEVEFLREVPRLIIEHNIHGIDIDPRAAQIAGLALWLRAQRGWQSMGLKPVDRPSIRKSNIVCAEPMPGEKELLAAFVTESFRASEQPFFQKLLDAVFEKMQIAGEAGSLLQIEEEIRFLVHEAREAWKQLGKQKGELFSEAELVRADMRSGTQLKLDLGSWSLDALSGIPDAEFWGQAEGRIYEALRTFAERAESSSGFQRRLFAEDAARGFAFIDLCRQRYDVALMNPPFGDASLPSKPYIEETYGDTKGDVYKAFVECFQARLVPAGYLGIISSRTGFFLGQSEDWRTRVVLRLFRPIALADLGMGVLDAMVEVAGYVLRSLSAPEARDLTLSIVPVLEQLALDKQERFSLPKWQAVRGGLKRHQAVAELEHLETHGFIQRSSGDTVRYTPFWPMVKKVPVPPEPVFPPFVCVRALSENDKGPALLHCISNPADPRVFVSDPHEFKKVPSVPFAYWIGNRVRDLFTTLPPAESDDRRIALGLSTKYDFRFVRVWWEVEPQRVGRDKMWGNYANGGSFSPFYFSYPAVVLAENGFAQLRAYISAKFPYLGGNTGWILHDENDYRSPAIAWPLRTHAFSPTFLPTDYFFSARTYAALVRRNQIAQFLGLFASKTVDFLLKVSLGRSGHPEFVTNVVRALPIPAMTTENLKLEGLATSAWQRKREIGMSDALSHAFDLPALLAVSDSKLAERAAAWTARVRTSEETVAAIQAEIDDHAFRLYGLDAADRAALTSTLAAEATSDAETDADAGEDEEEAAASADAPALAADLLAYVLGCAFGRWDIRYATGERPAPPAPDPFAPLPVCPPGMLRNDHGLPATPADVSTDYPLRITWPGILVDDPGHPEHDIGSRLQEVLEQLFPERPDAIEQEASELLGVRSLRDWFRKPAGFFADHLKRYSKSRRQAPIYWPLSSPKGLYTIWIYYHRLNADTLFTALRDFLEPKLQYEEQHAFQLKQEAGPTPSPSQRRDIIEADDLVDDLRALKDELNSVAPLFRPNLNDGVILNCASLWRMMSLPKWQKDCKAAWDSLSKGDYDWAHLALHLWPERVIPKCATDRSLAIAHGLEDTFWEITPEDELPKKQQGKGTIVWRSKKISFPDLQALITTHTSPAIKAALEALAKAPVAGGVKKGRKSAK